MLTEVPLQRPFTNDGGFAVTAAIPEAAQQMLRAGGAATLVENGVPLGPGESMHGRIRAAGSGAFSVWGPRLYFSASDNTDCNGNGREYALQVVDLRPGSQFYDLAQQRFSGDAELLEGITLNATRSKSLFSNFFGYFNYHSQVLARHGLALPANALELGCGDRPYTALRFLMEGVERCVVNDIGRIDAQFPREFLARLQDVARLVSPDLARRSRGLATEDAGNGFVRVRGLESYDQRPFESLALDDTFDFIYSVSVLEHVMDPAGVVARMHALLTPGGHASHSIDLRDHGHFDDPLCFLRLTEEQYDARRTENRLRASDWLRLFELAGLRVLECEYVTTGSPGAAESQYSFTEPAGQAWVEAQRDGFTAPFSEKSTGDLSTVAVRVLCEKPA